MRIKEKRLVAGRPGGREKGEGPPTQIFAETSEPSARLRADAAAIPRRKGRGPAPLSFTQEWWLSLEGLGPEGAASNRPSSLRLTGPLDVAALDRGLAEIVLRHEVLRTAFPLEEGVRVQRVLPPQNAPLALTDLSEHPEVARMDEALRLAEDRIRRPFDLAEGPLMRAELLRLGAEDHVLLLVTHHAVFDGWSAAVLVRELAALYEAFARRAPSPLAALPIQFADFAAWQREALTGPRLDALATFWKERLAGGARVPPLPADRARPPIPGLSGGSAHRTIAPALVRSLKELSRARGVTLYMTSLAAFQSMLGRGSGLQDIVTGCLVSDRTRVETESLIGLFFNALALRTDLSGDPTVAALLERVREVALAALAHQEMPIGELVRLLDLHPGEGESPIALVPVLFQMRNFPAAEAEAAGLKIAEFKHPSGMARFDLTFDLTETPDGLLCTLGYNRDLFEPATIAALLRDFEATLSAFAADPGQRLSALPPLPSWRGR